MRVTQVSNAVVRFGVFEADLRSGELRKNGVKVKIQELPFRALKFLLSRPDEVLSREEFRQALWPDGVFVDFDHGISSAINRLRDALGDSAENPLFVETVGRRGYRWIAPTHSPEAPAETAALTQAGLAVPPAANTSYRWKWIVVLPAFALLLVVWGFRPGRAAKASSKASPPSPFSSSVAPRRPPNPEARDLYLKGRFYWNKRTPNGLNKAVDYFTQAIVHDPGYAQAYVGLADCYNLLREYTMMPSSEAYPRALAAASKAVELDDQSSEAHASLAFVSFFGIWDAATAEREFRRAVALDPNNAVAHHWYATYLSTLHRYPESLREIELAQAIDPASKSILADKGAILCAAGRYKEGIPLLKQMEAAEPDFVSPHRYLRQAYFATGAFESYLVEARKEAVAMNDKVSLAINKAAEQGFASGGGKGLLLSMLRIQKRFFAQGRLSPYSLAQTCSLLGNKKEALQYLKIAYDRHDEEAVYLESDLILDPLHDEPAYQELVARMGFPPRN